MGCDVLKPTSIHYYYLACNKWTRKRYKEKIHQWLDYPSCLKMSAQLIFPFLVKIIVVAAIGSSLYVVFRFFYDSYRLRKFPGPVSFPVIGSCWDPGFVEVFRHFQTLSRRYGKIFKMFSFTRPVLVITEPHLVRRILSDHKTFFKGEDYTKYFGFSFGKGLITANGEDHRKGRSLLGKYFIRSSVAPFAGNVNQIMKYTIAEKLDSQIPKENSQLGFDCNVEELFAVLALRCFAKFSCDYDTSKDPEYEVKFCHKVSKGAHGVGWLMMFQLPLWSFIPPVKRVKDANDIMGILFERVTTQRQQALAEGKVFDDMLQAMIMDTTLSHEDRIGHFRTAIAAGHDTTAYFMSYCVYLLARNQDVQQQLYDYLQEKLGDKEIITADDTAELKFLQCVMMESLRLYPIVPNLSRECSIDAHIKDTKLDLVIPKDTTLLLSILAMNRDPDVWEEPLAFKPTRFENKASSDFTSAKDGYFPFGYGCRICIGNTLAQMEAAIILVHLIRAYRFTEVDGFRPKIRGGVSLTTSNGIKVHMNPRLVGGK